MADYIFDDWKKALDDFQKSVEKDLEEIHKQKAAIQQMKTEIFEELEGIRYYRSHYHLRTGDYHRQRGQERRPARRHGAGHHQG